MVDNYILTQIKKWLRHEVKYNQEIADAKDNNQTEVCSDGTDDISYGRHECALGFSFVNTFSKSKVTEVIPLVG